MLNQPGHEDHDFTASLLEWFNIHGRKTLPWQKNATPYSVWVSEIMLQQTQVETVIPYYRAFMQRFPDIASLANAQPDEVMEKWAGLGYYARARNLHQAAKIVCDQHHGVFPECFDDVVGLPGIGRSSAGAILAFSRNARHPILDGNVKRVLTRYFAIAGFPGKKEVENRLWAIAEELTPSLSVANYTQAIMDLGATVCVRSNPRCQQCPLRPGCLAFRANSVAEYPERKPGKKRPLRQTRMLLIRNLDSTYLVVKRPPTGIWGGLWSLPQLDDESLDYRQYCLDTFGIRIGEGREQPVVRHGFTHFDLEIRPVICNVLCMADGVMDAGQILWYNPSITTAVGMPAAVTKIFRICIED